METNNTTVFLKVSGLTDLRLYDHHYITDKKKKLLLRKKERLGKKASQAFNYNHMTQN